MADVGRMIQRSPGRLTSPLRIAVMLSEPSPEPDRQDPDHALDPERHSHRLRVRRRGRTHRRRAGPTPRSETLRSERPPRALAARRDQRLQADPGKPPAARVVAAQLRQRPGPPEVGPAGAVRVPRGRHPAPGRQGRHPQGDRGRVPGAPDRPGAPGRHRLLPLLRPRATDPRRQRRRDRRARRVAHHGRLQEPVGEGRLRHQPPRPGPFHSHFGVDRISSDFSGWHT